METTFYAAPNGADRLYLNVAIKISLLRSWSSAPTEIWLKFFNSEDGHSAWVTVGSDKIKGFFGRLALPIAQTGYAFIPTKRDL